MTISQVNHIRDRWVWAVPVRLYGNESDKTAPTALYVRHMASGVSCLLSALPFSLHN